VGLLQLWQYNWPALSVVFVSRVAIGLAAVVAATALQTLFQQTVPNTHLGRVSGAISTAMAFLSLLGVLGIAGLLGDALGVVPILNAAALVTILAGFIPLLWLPSRPAAPSGASPNP
jgi:hypothetical protein